MIKIHGPTLATLILFAVSGRSYRLDTRDYDLSLDPRDLDDAFYSRELELDLDTRDYDDDFVYAREEELDFLEARDLDDEFPLYARDWDEDDFHFLQGRNTPSRSNSLSSASSSKSNEPKRLTYEEKRKWKEGTPMSNKPKIEPLPAGVKPPPKAGEGSAANKTPVKHLNNCPLPEQSGHGHGAPGGGGDPSFIKGGIPLPGSTPPKKDSNWGKVRGKISKSEGAYSRAGTVAGLL